MSDAFAIPKDRKKEIERGIRAALLVLESATKVELSQRLSVSFPTITKFLNQMEQDGEVTLLGLDESSGGRRANRYAYNPEYRHGLAIFLEKTETMYTIFNSFGQIKAEGSTAAVLEAGREALATLIESLLAQYPKIGSVAIGVPGAVNQGRIVFIPTYELFDQFDLKNEFESRFGIPVVVENDMNAAVLGYYANRQSGEHSLAYLYFGQNGPGAGIMVGGALVRGSTFFSGEVSFVPQYDDRNFYQALGKQDNKETGIQLGEGEIDAISRLVASLTAILNPHAVIFCDDEVTAALLSQIAARSEAYIPKEHLPRLVMSEWRQDYLNGLQRLGLDLMIAGTAS